MMKIIVSSNGRIKKKRDGDIVVVDDFLEARNTYLLMYVPMFMAYLCAKFEGHRW